MTMTNQLACQDADPELFFPDLSERDYAWRIETAKSICADCPVRRACLGMAILRQETEGIWGGYTAAERKALLRDAQSLRREVGRALQQLEAGQKFPVDTRDLLAVVHRLSKRGWSVERLSDALGVSPRAVLRTRQRALYAIACLAAVDDATLLERAA